MFLFNRLLFVALISLTLMNCSKSSNSNNAENPAPNNPTSLPDPTDQAATANGKSFLPDTVTMKDSLFQPGYQELIFFKSTSTNPCQGFPELNVRVLISNANLTSRINLNINDMNNVAIFYDYDNGKNANIVVGTGWFQLSALDTPQPMITANIDEGTNKNFVRGKYPITICK